eukprot:695482-Prymnesium_polylepis.1
MSTLALASEIVSPPAPMPMFPPPAHVSDVWPGFESDSGSEVEVVALNGPTLETRGFFEKARTAGSAVPTSKLMGDLRV